MYSLTNIATLVRDVARHERGTAIADDLVHAFALDPDSLLQLDAVTREPDLQLRRDRLLQAARQQPRALELLAATRSAADTHGLAAYSAALPALETAPMFGLDELVRFVRDDVLADAWSRVDDVAVARFPTALDIVTDGVVGSWSGDALLGAAWRRWVATASNGEETGTLLLDAVAAFARLRPTVTVSSEWANEMHEACWAVHLTGRARVAAVTQLQALRKLLRAWAPDRPPPASVATVTAAVHAHVVADILPSRTHRAMTAPIFSRLT